MKPIYGENLHIFVKEDDLLANGSSALIYLGLAATCELDITTDAMEYTSKDSGSWKESKPGMKGWSMSTSNLYTEHADKLLALQINRTILRLWWTPARNTESGNAADHTPDLNIEGQTLMQYSGMAWINSFHANASNGETANYTVNFTGTGPLTPYSKLPGAAVGVDQPNLSILAGESAQVIASGFTGTLTATCSYTGVTCTVGAGGVVTVDVADTASAGATHILLSDSGTSTTCYVSLIVRTT